MISSLQPKGHELVYDLVREAGVDVSDWSNYDRPDLPQTNPKYCYNWSFFGSDRVVICLWFDEMQEDDLGIFQHLNYSEIPEKRGASSVRRRRAMDMNRAFFTAFRDDLIVRVIIVHDPDDQSDDREVKLRALDPVEWHVASYDEDTGWCRIQRGPKKSDAIPQDGSHASRGHRVSMVRFRSELENLKAHLLDYDGFPFESFTRGKIYDWESYKDYVFAEAGRRLAWQTWDSEEVGTGAILDRVIHAIEINEGKDRRNNLLKWQQYGVHQVLTDARNDKRCFEVESLLFDFYTGELAAEDAFDPLTEHLGKKYPLIAYLFFIKDNSRYLPISPAKFSQAFERLGVSLNTAGECSWENYSAYLSVIREIRDFLELEGFDGIRLLDAHSFCWLLINIDEPEEVSGPRAQIEEFDASTQLSGSKSKKDVDWEALHRARAALGRLGEELALDAEKSRLTDAGHPDLAAKIHLVSEDHTKGYDLHSFETDGSDRLIEVKTMSEDRPAVRFYTSQRQLELAHSEVNHFYYLVRGARTAKPRIQAVRAHSIPEEAISPIVHEVAWTDATQDS